jgi:hypothetical protein
LAERRRNQNLYGHTVVSPLLGSGHSSLVALTILSDAWNPPNKLLDRMRGRRLRVQA